MKIAPSLLATGFKDLDRNLSRISNADYVHIDVMDGYFVSEKTVDHELVGRIKTGLVKDVHLMIQTPEKFVKDYIDAGADLISFHVEACRDPSSLIKYIKSFGVKVSIALNPETSVDKVLNYLGSVDQVLVMSVHPGRGGQEFISGCLDKIRMIRRLFPLLDIQVDGGINLESGFQAARAGANVLVSGSFIFDCDCEKTIELLRKTNI